MKSIIAVSGGVDSMVLFDMAMNGEIDGVEPRDVVVAHFNHGTRPSADEDQEFVRERCKERGAKFVSKKYLLGDGVSEEDARRVRYDFLKQVAKEHGRVQILVAHHLDDLIESITINLIRGTGWRGLTPMWNPDLRRPFLELEWGRANILKYAAEHEVNFRFDPTNGEDKYLRNRVREKVLELDLAERRKIYELYKAQCQIRSEIEELILEMIGGIEQIPRAWFTDGENDTVSVEILREILTRKNISATRPQLLDFLQAIKTYSPGKKFNLPGNKFAKIYKTYFMV